MHPRAAGGALFSARTAFDRRLNALSLDLASVRARGQPLLDLSGSNPTEAGLPYQADVILGALANSRALRYQPESFGLRETREHLASVLPHPASPDAMMLTASTSEAYGILFKLLGDPGDEIAVPAPSYPLFDHLASLECLKLVPYRLAYDGAWHLDADSLRRAISPKTRAIVVVNPNNPTGSYLKRDELSILSAYGLPILSDEVFSDYPFAPDATRVVTARESREVLTFSMGGLSKACGLPQLKLAWTSITGPAAEVQEAAARLEIVADAYLSASTPVQLALPMLLAAGAETQRAICERTLRNRAALSASLTKAHSAATLLHVEGGWTACLRLPKTRSEHDWIRALLFEESTLVQPGAFYEFADDPMIVLSLLTPPETFDDGVSRLVRKVQAG